MSRDPLAPPRLLASTPVLRPSLRPPSPSPSTSKAIERRVSFDLTEQGPTPQPQQRPVAVDLGQLSQLLDKKLDEKLSGLARSDQIDKVSGKVDRLQDEVIDQRADLELLKLDVAHTQREVKKTEDRIMGAVREEIKKNDERKEAAALAIPTPMLSQNAQAPTTTPALNPSSAPPQTIDLVSVAGSAGSNNSSYNFETMSRWEGSSGSGSGSVSSMPRFLAGAVSQEQEDVRRGKFETSRRSLLVWPIEGRSETKIMLNFREFLVGALKFRNGEISTLGILRTIRTILPARTHAHNEIRVIFKDARGRDMVSMRGRHLGKYVGADKKPTAGFRLDIPDYLTGDFKLLEETGYQLRAEWGEELRKYIKYDEAQLSLYLEVQFSKKDKRWTRVTPAIAREIRECNDRVAAEHIKQRMRRRSAENVSSNYAPLIERGLLRVKDRAPTEQ